MTTNSSGDGAARQSSKYETVLIDYDEGIAWVTMNRPDKRNAMSPTLNREMLEVLEELEVDDSVGVVVLTGAGDSWTAGMDLKEYFRETDSASAAVKTRIRRAAGEWQWRKLNHFPKPTIAMVNGWCFGGAFTPLVACDLAIAADEATFGVSEINWGIIPGGNVTKALSQAMSHKAALYYIMTGEPFGGAVARDTGLVNESVPLARLRERTRELAKVLLAKNPTVLRQAKNTFKRIGSMDWDLAEDYTAAKAAQTAEQDPEQGRKKGMSQFLDEKTIRPGLQTYRRDD
jgi:feruloyl-CoA hydratase/lyase